MDRLAKLRGRLKELPGEPVALLCLRLLDFFETTPINELQFLTIESFCRALEINEPNYDLIAALSLLTNNHEPILDRGILFLDPDGEEYLVDLEEWDQASQSGYMVHPNTGEAIYDYEDHLVLYYTAAARLEADVK